MKFRSKKSKSSASSEAKPEVLPERPEKEEKKESPNSALEGDEDDFDSEDVSKILLTQSDIKKKNCQSCQTLIPAAALRCFSCHADQPVDPLNANDSPVQVIKNSKSYKIYRTTIVDEDDKDLPPFYSYIFKLKEKSLINSLSSYCTAMSHCNKKTSFGGYKARATVRARALIMILPQLRSALQYLPQNVRDFIQDEIEPMREEMIISIKKYLKKRKIPSDGLWYLYEPGTAVYGFDEHGNKVGSLVKAANYQPGFLSDNFGLTGSVIKCDGEQFYYSQHTFVVPGYSGVKKIDDLPVRALDRKTLEELDIRGIKFNELAVGHHYQQFRGTMIRNIGSFSVKSRTASRIMVDITTFNRRHPNISTYRNPTAHNGIAQMIQMNKEERWMSYPLLPAFNFQLKSWGEFSVRDIKPIEFDTEAFQRLVLPSKKKSLILALVEDYRKNVEIINELENRAFKQLEGTEPIDEAEGLELVDAHGNCRLFTDLITGKGGGCIFLLHGSPGVGKTLTAEAVCEHLSIPLYMITVGELGTTPAELEKNLHEILELSALWGCGILLDEADIFLEKRSKTDILRNAMVGIFLRLLEYHNGVLFLTTNRLSCIDEAFSSRISVALHYHDLDADARKQIWETFLNASVSNESALQAMDLDKLASFELNGRQIRSCVRLSVSRARIAACPLSMDHLLDTIRLSVDFKTQFFDEKVAQKTRKREDLQHQVHVKLPDPFQTAGGPE